MQDEVGVPEMQVVVGCADLDAALDHFTSVLGLRVDRISPADSPREADLSGHGIAVGLRRDAAAPTAPALGLDDLRQALAGSAPAGVVVAPRPPPSSGELPPLQPALVVSRRSEADGFGAGRVGMGYRDLIPGRLGGRFIASHIRIDGGGEVPDYAHYHHVRFQMIYCYRGWVRVVYEDQGPPFVLAPGDCVLQPPGIRHRVLESSPGLEVIEIGCPADHDTFADHEIVLPTGVLAPQREFGGQRFVRHVAAAASWEPLGEGRLERDTGIGAATHGLAGARVLRLGSDTAVPPTTHHAELLFRFVLDGAVTLGVGERRLELGPADSVVIPPAEPFSMVPVGPGTEILEVSLPDQWGQTPSSVGSDPASSGV